MYYCLNTRAQTFDIVNTKNITRATASLISGHTFLLRILVRATIEKVLKIAANLNILSNIQKNRALKREDDNQSCAGSILNHLQTILASISS